MANPATNSDTCELRLVDKERVKRAQQLLLSHETYTELAHIFGALADPNRAKIVYSLLHQELCVCDIAAVLSVSESAVSQHLRLLRALRLVKYRRAGKMAYYSLNDDHVRVLLDVCLEHLKHQ